MLCRRGFEYVPLVDGDLLYVACGGEGAGEDAAPIPANGRIVQSLDLLRELVAQGI